ncbi:hypothetical protein M5K25_005968 [Dendrobium thyrsiflorum]|uniref:Uncharacterized protein n=1 Tax=Dendrobium thyrsiflorum TaxID=117978 RepID=A0ABD0VB45_DENTH
MFEERLNLFQSKETDSRKVRGAREELGAEERGVNGGVETERDGGGGSGAAEEAVEVKGEQWIANSRDKGGDSDGDKDKKPHE